MKLWIVIHVDEEKDVKALTEDLIVNALKHTYENIHVERIGNTILIYKRG